MIYYRVEELGRLKEGMYTHKTENNCCVKMRLCFSFWLLYATRASHAFNVPRKHTFTLVDIHCGSLNGVHIF